MVFDLNNMAAIDDVIRMAAHNYNGEIEHLQDLKEIYTKVAIYIQSVVCVDYET